jgi:polysaccharide deacetylase family protein (PEP-CTERM system associated)
MKRPPDILTIDVEEWFHGHNYLPHVPPGVWDQQESRVERNTAICLDLLRSHDVKATFFVLGWTARRHPELIGRIAAEGHEIASHSFSHPVVFELGEDDFRRDLDLAREALSQCGIESVAGYRAPSFTLTPAVHNYLAILEDSGFSYDCSIFPVHHPRYGQPNSPRHAFLCSRDLVELPMTTVRLLGVNLPFSGGGYMRMLPMPVYRRMRSVALRQNQPVIIYLHPWELDDIRPNVGMGFLTRLRSQGGQNTMRDKLDQILSEGTFRTMGNYVGELRDSGKLLKNNII